MIDYTLKFPSEQVSFEMAHKAGLTCFDEKAKEYRLYRYTSEYGIFVQGYIIIGATYSDDLKLISPSKTLEGWWVRVRILADKPIPESFVPFITSETPEGLWGIA